MKERLARAFADVLWWRKFPLCKLSVSHVIKSDHDPILLEHVHVEFSRKQFRFKFENTWLNEPSFKEEVTRFWGNIPKMHLLPKLLSVSSFMARWCWTFFHKFRHMVKKQKEVISALVNRSDVEGIQRYFEESRRLDELLIHEELYWKQRAKSFWLTEGDSNSKNFMQLHRRERKQTLSRISSQMKEK